MREIEAREIARSVAKLCIDANYHLGGDVLRAFREAHACEENAPARTVLSQLLENAEIAAEGNLPLCQDTGMAVVFLEIGQEVHITGGALTGAVNEGVRQGYTEGYLRKSMVRDPIDRVNTGDNTPAVLHCTVVPGDRLKIVVAPKGIGSENMSRLAMLKPAQGLRGIKDFVVDTVRIAGPNPCPPIVVGIGIGGTTELACKMSKHALLREIGSRNEDPFWDDVERELLAELNALGIGPAGLGGRTTAMAAHIETFAAHIGGLPVAVNIGCHASRHAETTL